MCTFLQFFVVVTRLLFNCREVSSETSGVRANSSRLSSLALYEVKHLSHGERSYVVRMYNA